MKFMVCYDGSDQADKTLKAARHHARVWGANLEVVHVLTREMPLKHSLIRDKEARLEAQVNTQLESDVIPYNTQLLITSLDPGQQIVEFAQEEKIDQIFIGIVKKSKVGKLLFGSTAQFVILYAPCPVVVIKG